MHAFLESAVNLLICHHIGKPEIEKPISKIGIRQRAHLAAAMQLLPTDEVRMIEELRTLRNRLVHNPKNTDFSLTKYLESPDNRASFSRRFCVAWSASEDGSRDFEAEARVLAQRHLAVWMSTLLVALRSGSAKAQKDLEKLEQQFGRTWMAITRKVASSQKRERAQNLLAEALGRRP